MPDSADLLAMAMPPLVIAPAPVRALALVVALGAIPSPLITLTLVVGSTIRLGAIRLGLGEGRRPGQCDASADEGGKQDLHCGRSSVSLDNALAGFRMHGGESRRRHPRSCPT
jgi:hypothetical protein